MGTVSRCGGQPDRAENRRSGTGSQGVTLQRISIAYLSVAFVHEAFEVENASKVGLETRPRATIAGDPSPGKMFRQ